MALPYYPTPLSISMIRNELGTSSGSLRTLSLMAGFFTPYAISKFYGYSPVVNYTAYWTFDAGVQYSYFQIFNNTKGTEAASVGFSGPGFEGSSFQASPGDLISVYVYGVGDYESPVGISAAVYDEYFNYIASASEVNYPDGSVYVQFYMPNSEATINMSTSQYYWWM